LIFVEVLQTDLKFRSRSTHLFVLAGLVWGLSLACWISAIFP
jgi:hypothetical protein